LTTTIIKLSLECRIRLYEIPQDEYDVHEILQWLRSQPLSIIGQKFRFLGFSVYRVRYRRNVSRGHLAALFMSYMNYTITSRSSLYDLTNNLHLFALVPRDPQLPLGQKVRSTQGGHSRPKHQEMRNYVAILGPRETFARHRQMVLVLGWSPIYTLGEPWKSGKILAS
jgi:hypothetical protein